MGCDEGSSGAVEWVKPNIVNVAASRAKSRLYVVGDSSVWCINPSVRKMKQILDRYYIDKLDELCSQCTNDSGVLSMPDDDVSVLDADLPEEALRVPDSILRSMALIRKIALRMRFLTLIRKLESLSAISF